MNKGFLGGLLSPAPHSIPHSATPLIRWSALDVRNWLWTWDLEDEVFVWDQLALVILGHLRLAGSNKCLNREQLAEELRWRYLEEGVVDLAGLEGNATVILLDAQARQLLLVRPANALTPVYYQHSSQGIRFASTPALLARTSDHPPTPNHHAALQWLNAGMFLDRETLFTGISRLLPDEVVLITEHGETRGQLSCGWRKVSPSVDQVRRATADTLQAARAPWIELNGSLASTALQILRNEMLEPEELLPITFSLCIDVPTAWARTDHSIHCSQTLGTEHHLIAASPSPREAWRRTLAATGEPVADDAGVFVADYGAELKARGAQTLWLDAGGDGWPAATLECQEKYQSAERYALGLWQEGLQVFAPLLHSRLFSGSDRFSTMRTQMLSVLQLLVPSRLRPGIRSRPASEAWLRPDGPLASALDQVRTFNLCSEQMLQRARRRPGLWLLRLLAYDFWYQVFVERAQTAPSSDASVPRQVEHPTSHCRD
jgi:hypothetical protein